VVDADSGARADLQTQTMQWGYATESLDDREAVLKVLSGGNFHLLIADPGPLEETGFDWLRKIVAVHPRLPVVLVSEDGQVDVAVRALHEGAADYLIKPIDSNLLKGAVEFVTRKVHHQDPSAVAATDGKSSTPSPIITDDEAVKGTMALARRVAPSSVTILINGESGTGKELLAAYIHQHSGRRQAALVAMNCAALPEQLAESELFGHEKGAFTGAVRRKLGKFEQAHQGTLLLDEISELSTALQAKLLRAIQEKVIDRVGGNNPITVDVRIIAISNVDLKEAVAQGRFREDLFYRINVVPLRLPPLRERCADLPLLCDHFLETYCRQNGLPLRRLSKEAFHCLSRQPWKGNIRELQNTIQRAVLIATSENITPADLLLEDDPSEDSAPPPFQIGTTVKEMEKQLIFNTLSAVNSNRSHAAKMLGISIRTLRNKLNEYRSEKDDSHHSQEI